MRTIVISQPMYFPWVGLFEQVALADQFVHYDDVSYSKGSFTNRVQIKITTGSAWLTLPVKLHHLGQRIVDTEIDDRQNWRRTHRRTLLQNYVSAPFKHDMLQIVDRVFAIDSNLVAEVGIKSIEAVAEYFGLSAATKFVRSSSLNCPGESSQRVVNIVRLLGGDVYITGHGAREYLEHELFESAGIRVEYMDYQKRPYSQLHGEFTPYVSILDLIANRGKGGLDIIVSGSKYWKEFLNSPGGSNAPI